MINIYHYKLIDTIKTFNLELNEIEKILGHIFIKVALIGFLGLISSPVKVIHLRMLVGKSLNQSL